MRASEVITELEKGWHSSKDIDRLYHLVNDNTFSDEDMKILEENDLVDMIYDSYGDMKVSQG